MNRRKFVVSATCAAVAIYLPSERRNIIVSEKPPGYIYIDVLEYPVTEAEIEQAVREFEESHYQRLT